MHINVNFKIIEVVPSIGAILVEYLADGATKERFGADAGPYRIPIPTNFATMTSEELNHYIASQGLYMVKQQKIIMDAESNGVFDTLNSLVNNEVSFELDDGSEA